MPVKQPIVLATVALLSAGLGAAITSRMGPKRVRVGLDLGNGQALDVGEMAGGLEEARMSINENQAIATLRAIAAGQQQLRASGAIDTDDDGGGEYGYFGELAGAVPMRIMDHSAGLPALGSLQNDLLFPPILAAAFGSVVSDGRGHGVVERAGYYFKIFLPGPTADGIIPGVPEAPTGGTSPDNLGASWSSTNAEDLWCAYAWPVKSGKSGKRAFFINQAGDIEETVNAGNRYSGLNSTPEFDAALSLDSPRDMGAPLAIRDGRGNDGLTWLLGGY